MLKRTRILITCLVILSISNIALIGLLIHERTKSNDVDKVWDLGTKNAVYLLQQYDESHFEEGYRFTLGEIGTIYNSISLIEFGEQGELTDAEELMFSTFYYNLFDEEEFMKEHITQVREIISLIQAKDNAAFIKMKELLENNE